MRTKMELGLIDKDPAAGSADAELIRVRGNCSQRTGGDPVAAMRAPTTLLPVKRDFLAAGLVDHMHIVQVPIVLGRGVRVWDGLQALEQDYEIEPVSVPSGVTPLTFTRKTS